MLLTYEKLSRRAPQLARAAVRAARPVDNVWMCRAPGSRAESAMAPPPPAGDPAWAPIRPGERWGGSPGEDPNAPPVSPGWGIPAGGGGNYWLRATFRVPAAWRGKEVLLGLDWDAGRYSEIEGIVYLDGHVLAGIDKWHRAALLPAAAHEGQHEMLLRCYVAFSQPFRGLRLLLRDGTIFKFGQVFASILGAVGTYPENAPERFALLDRLNAAYNTLDLREGAGSARFAASAARALDLLEPLLAGLPSAEPPFGPPTVLATGHAHLDVAWLWPLWRTRQKVAHTVANALHLMERYPDYRFSMSQPQVYAFLKENDPELYARLKQRVAEGRLEPVGMMWLEADCNVTSGESLVRQLMFGARFFAEEFGEQNHVVWLPDVFGYSAALPQLMRLCGISCFMTTKISWNQFNRMPVDTFRWRGIDGTEVLAHFITATDQPATEQAGSGYYTYNGNMSAAEVKGLWNHYKQKDLNTELIYSYGWGDGGGGPTEEMLEAARVFRALPGFPRVTLGRVDDYFQRLYERVWEDPHLPRWVGELYLEYHRGTYTGQARIKQNNRAAELLYREAEWLNAWATTLGAPSQQDELNEGWKLILLNQFHDILPGSSIGAVYEESEAQHAEVQRIGRKVSEAALEAILGDKPSGGPAGLSTAAAPAAEEATSAAQFAVVNSLPWERTEPLAIALRDDDPPGAADGAAGQVVNDLAGERALLVEAQAPPYGFGRVSLGRVSSERRSSPLQAGRTSLRNGELRLELDDNGEIASLYDMAHGREAIADGATGNQLVAYEDRPLRWSAWDIDIFYEEKPYPVHEIRDWRVVEEGPVRAAIEITRAVGKSTIRQRICMWRASRRVDFVTEVNWQERQTLLRALFPLRINASRATCEIQFGSVERPTHRNTSWDWARFEVCAHRWVDLSEGGYGVALLNNCKYGHSLHDNLLGLSLLKGAVFPDRNADRGLHRFTYSLLPHLGDWREAQVVRRAYELNAPLLAWPLRDGNSLPRSSFLSTDCGHIVVETVKTAEDGDGLIVRLYEAHNERGPASIRFAREVASAEEVDLLERPTGPADVAGDSISFVVRPFEVKTFRVRFR